MSAARVRMSPLAPRSTSLRGAGGDAGAAEAASRAEAAAASTARFRADSSTAVVVTLEEASEKTAGKDAEAYLQAAVDDMVASINGSNVAYESNGGTVEFEGINRSIPAMVTKITNDGAELWIGQACADVDGNFFNISVVGPSEEAVSQAFSCFAGAAK